MSDNNEQNVDSTNSEQKNNESEVSLSKSAKRRAKKNQKKAAEAAEATGATGTSQNQQVEKNKAPVETNDNKAVKLDDSASKPTEKKASPVKPDSKKGSPAKAETKKAEKKKTTLGKIDEHTESSYSTSADTKNEDHQVSTSKKGKQSQKTPTEQKPVPRIQKFDANGKPIKTLAGRNSLFLGTITPHNVFQLKKLNEAVLPIKYNDKFYVEARTCGDFGRLAYFNDVVAGAVCCRIDDISDEKALYIMTLGTLAAYRQIGIGAVLIDYVHHLCEDYEEISSVYLHVQVNNTNAVHFYEKHGFTNDGIIEDYYRIEPRDAYLLIKRIRQ